MKYLITFLAATLLISCKGNTLYFDLDKKEIRTCNNAIISRIMVEKLGDNSESYLFKLKTGNLGLSVMNIQNPDTIFSITEMPFREVNNSEFKLMPSAKYKISNLSNGDARESFLIIFTDKNSQIIQADKLECN